MTAQSPKRSKLANVVYVSLLLALSSLHRGRLVAGPLPAFVAQLRVLVLVFALRLVFAVQPLWRVVVEPLLVFSVRIHVRAVVEPLPAFAVARVEILNRVYLLQATRL